MRTSSADTVVADAQCYERGPLRDATGVTIRPGGLALTERAVELCHFRRGARILDVGCGAGGTVEHLRRSCSLDAVGVDTSTALIAEGRGRNSSLPLAEAGADALPFDDATHEGVLCECVLSVLERPQDALAEFRRVLRSGGYLVVSDLYAREARSGSSARAAGEMTRECVESWLAESGFSLVLWEDHSDALAQLAARLILANGSLDGLVCVTQGLGDRPGYFLLVARATPRRGA